MNKKLTPPVVAKTVRKLAGTDLAQIRGGAPKEIGFPTLDGGSKDAT